MSLVSALSPSEKLQLNVALSASMIEKAPSSRKGKPASMGIRAWTAFVAHVQATMPERFAPPALPKERLVIAGAIRLEDPAAYEAFCAKFKADAAPVPEAAHAPEAAPEGAAVQELEAQFTAICATLDAKYPEEGWASAAAPEPVPEPVPEPKAEAAPEAAPAPAPVAKPKKQLSAEHLAKLKAGREKKAAEKAEMANASLKRPATEAPEGAPPAKKARIE